MPNISQMWWIKKLSKCRNMRSTNIKHIGTDYSQTVQNSVQFSRSVMSNFLWPHEPQHTRPPCPSPTPRVYPNPCPLSQWCHPTISSSATPYSSCPQAFPASGSFPIRWLFTSSDKSIGGSASTSVLPVNIQGWFPLGLTGLISLLSKELSRVFCTILWNHQFFSTQPS